MLAKGSAIKQDAVNKAKAFDEKHQFRANASAKVISLDRRVGLSEKLTVGISVVNEKMKTVDQKLQVSDKTIAALMAAERKLNNTGSAVKSSKYDKSSIKDSLFSVCTCMLCNFYILATLFLVIGGITHALEPQTAKLFQEYLCEIHESSFARVQIHFP